MSAETLQTVIDSMFEIVESRESGLALVLTAALQRAVDANVGAILALVESKLADR